MYDTDTTASFDALSNARQHSAASPTLQVIRRNGAAVAFDSEKISIAISKAFLAVERGQTSLYPRGYKSSRMREQVTVLTQTVVTALMRRSPSGGTVHIEDIQDQVELALMRSGEHDVAKAYMLSREKRAAERAGQAHVTPQLHITVDGGKQPLALAQLIEMVDGSLPGFRR